MVSGIPDTTDRLLLAVSSAVLLVAFSLPPPLSLLTTLAVAASLLAIHFRYNRWLLAHTPSELAFEDELIAISTRLTTAHDRLAESGDRTAFRQELERAIRDLETLEEPNAQWAEVKTLAFRLVRERLRLHDARSEHDQKARVKFRSDRAALHERLRLARARTRRFWRILD